MDESTRNSIMSELETAINENSFDKITNTFSKIDKQAILSPQNGKSSILYHCVHKGTTAMLSFLIQNGANPSSFCQQYSSNVACLQTTINTTPLVEAVTINRIDMVLELLKNNADPDVKCENSWEEVYFNGDTAYKGYFAETALSLAKSNNHPELVEILTPVTGVQKIR